MTDQPTRGNNTDHPETPDQPQPHPPQSEAETQQGATGGDANQSPDQQTQGAGQQPHDDRSLHDKVIDVLKQVYDPEIPVNLYDLGLIYKVDVNEETGRVGVLMTLTTPNCPEAQSMPGHVEQAVLSLPETSEANVEITWDPPWSMDKMSDEAKLMLGMM